MLVFFDVSWVKVIIYYQVNIINNVSNIACMGFNFRFMQQCRTKSLLSSLLLTNNCMVKTKDISLIQSYNYNSDKVVLNLIVSNKP